jgi:hypothetical protein
MVKTSTQIIGALALAGALMSNGPASAAQPTPGLQADLNAARTSADVVVPVDCDAAQADQTKTTSVSVKIFQSVGRLLNIGTGSGTPTCTGQLEDVNITVNAIPGLKFQPGPSTILIKLTETTTTPPVPPLTTPTVTITETESGARVDLRP